MRRRKRRLFIALHLYVPLQTDPGSGSGTFVPWKCIRGLFVVHSLCIRGTFVECANIIIRGEV